MLPLRILVVLLLFHYMPSLSQGQRYPMDSTLFTTFQYRCIGPFRGGRASGVCGDYKNKQVFYMGSTGGGVWQTKDGGNNWKNISDKYFGGSIGSVEVCPTDPLLIYVGTGENTMRGNVSEGHGMWKSVDGGKSWNFVGLSDTRHITKIVFHPKNPDIVYCAATGHLFGPNEERGVFKTSNGGKSWEKILFVNTEVGAVDMVIDPVNPNVLYASTWRVKRTPYSMESGGEGCALWKTIDGGKQWTNISGHKGFPKDTLGIIGIAIAPSNTDRLYALVESKTGGLFTSDNGGETWEKVNSESKIRQRAWYFSKVFVDPKNEQLVYVCNVEFFKSQDGGKSFNALGTPHGDHHNLWIDPEDGQRMAIADDGGVQISFDGGSNWSTYQNQPTAQFYRVSTDQHFPYRVLGCQQDNSSVRILSRSQGGGIGQQDWSSTAGFESGYAVADPLNDDIVYGGNYGGYLSRYNHRTGENRTVSVYPVSPIGEGADVLKYRFQWNFPLLFSPHQPNKLYAAGNKLFVTENEGQTWKAISPDLTTNDKRKQLPSGGMITKDNTGVEYYCTIFTIAESRLQKDLIWTGSDDGLLHVTQNGGVQWEKVTPKQSPEWMMFNCIEPSPYDAATCYAVGTRYKLDDFKPYIFRTRDYGKTWQLITRGIPNHHFTRCLRADPKTKGVLYCGTEEGMYISYDDGEQWLPFQLNLPKVPITDLAIQEDNLVVATQGRSFWILDELSVIHQIKSEIKNKKLNVLKPALSYRTSGYQNKNPHHQGMNPPNGVKFNYWLSQVADSTVAIISIFNQKDSLLRTFTSNNSKKEEAFALQEGMNAFVWNMQVKGEEKLADMVLWNGQIDGFKVPPGDYKAKIKVGKDSVLTPFTIAKDPNYNISQEDYEKQFQLLSQIRNKFSTTQTTIKQIRQIKNQINGLQEKLGKDYPKDLDSLGKKIIKAIDLLEEKLYQTKAVSGQDLLNYPIRLNDKLVGIFDAANQNTPPHTSVMEAYSDIGGQIDQVLSAFKKIKDRDIAKYNQLVNTHQIGWILLKEGE